MGDQVIPDAYTVGYATVVALNKSTGVFTVLGNHSSEYHRYTLNELGVVGSCFRGLCVGDQVFPDAYTTGYATIRAIDYNTGTFTVLGNHSSEYHRYSDREISLTNACEISGPEREDDRFEVRHRRRILPPLR